MTTSAQQSDHESEYQALIAQLEALEPGLTAKSSANPFASALEEGPTTLPTLLKALEDEDPERRGAAAEAIGQLGITSGAALRQLRQMVQTDPDGNVRQSAAIAVLQIGGDELLAEVTKNLRDDDPEVVAHAAVTLGKVGDPRVVPNLLQAFQTEDLLVGSAIAWALGRLKDKRAISWLDAALVNGFVPANAAEALGRIGDIEAVPILLRTLDHPNADARAYAARALGMLEPDAEQQKGLRAQAWLQRKDEIIDALYQLLEDEPYRKAKLFACLALFELGDRAGGKQFLALLQEA